MVKGAGSPVPVEAINSGDGTKAELKGLKAKASPKRKSKDSPALTAGTKAKVGSPSEPSRKRAPSTASLSPKPTPKPWEQKGIVSDQSRQSEGGN